MATYKLKKTDKTDLGDAIYEMTISLTDANGESQEVKAHVALPKTKTKQAAQAYADELEATINKAIKSNRNKEGQ